jgi:cbb3-type cytochrome oxidase cytochrome c subunit
MTMTPFMATIGSTAVFMVVVFIVVFFPLMEQSKVQDSTILRDRTDAEERGRALYIANGCQYCHSQYVRPQDYDYGQDRVAQAGDYNNDRPPLLGSERQGPDLSREGGLRSDGWHFAHFINPRNTRPDSLMPPFHWLSVEDMKDLTSYVQGLGFLDADQRMERQERWRGPAFEAYQQGPAANTEWLHERVPEAWLEMPNPYAATPMSIARGEITFQHFCIGCHGPVGDGRGPGGQAMLQLIEDGHLEEAPPYNFTYLKNWDGPIGGMIYYQVMNGITGTSMPAFKHELESQKIWDVANYLATHFAGRDSVENDDPEGIPASYEPPVPGETGYEEETRRRTFEGFNTDVRESVEGGD